MQTTEQNNLINAGININIPSSTFVYLGLSILIPTIIILVTKFSLDRL